jgi:hypothetical protein
LGSHKQTNQRRRSWSRYAGSVRGLCRRTHGRHPSWRRRICICNGSWWRVIGRGRRREGRGYPTVSFRPTGGTGASGWYSAFPRLFRRGRVSCGDRPKTEPRLTLNATDMNGTSCGASRPRRAHLWAAPTAKASRRSQHRSTHADGNRRSMDATVAYLSWNGPLVNHAVDRNPASPEPAKSD